jgi:hypothetical protein
VILRRIITMMIDLSELYIGVEVNEIAITFFKDLTEATIYASNKINKGDRVKMVYCDKYGCKIM